MREEWEVKISLCDATLWYKREMNPPILSGENYHKCGPNNNFTICSTNKSDWNLEIEYGPCCSTNGYCGLTSDHCNNPGVDFREIISDDVWDFKAMILIKLVELFRKKIVK